MGQEQRPMGMEDNLAVVMMLVRRSVRTALREAVREEGLTQNEIEVLLFLERGKFDTARDISRVRGMPRSLVSKAVDQLVAARKEFFNQLCQGITKEEAAAFYSMVEKMTKNLDQNKFLSEDVPEERKEESV